MSNLDQMMRLMYLQDRIKRQKKTEEAREVSLALSEFAKIASSSNTTASNLSDEAVKTYDTAVTQEAKNKIESLKTGVGYLDNLLDSQINKIELHEKKVGTVNAIEESLRAMENKIWSSPDEPSEGFLATLKDHKKTLTDMSASMTALKKADLIKQITAREEEFEFGQRMSSYDTDMSTPEIDWDPNVTAHTKNYINDLIVPEAKVSRVTGDYTKANKLFEEGPEKMRTERASIAKTTAANVKAFNEEKEKFYDDMEEGFEVDAGNVIVSGYGVVNKELEQAKDALNVVVNKNPDMRSLLGKISTDLSTFGGRSEDAIRTLDTKEVGKDIDSDIGLLVNILRQRDKNIPSFASAFMQTGKNKDKEIIKGVNQYTYDPFNPVHKNMVDTYLEDNIYNPTTGFKQNKPFFKNQNKGSGIGMAYITAMQSYIQARQRLHETVSFVNQDFTVDEKGNEITNPDEIGIRRLRYQTQSKKYPGWFYPEDPAPQKPGYPKK